MPRKLILSLLLCLLATTASAQTNLVFYMSDDQTINTVSAYGPGLNGLAITPNIDAIAAAGARYSNSFVVYSLCKPSRSTHLTGLYPARNGVISNEPTDEFDPNMQTIQDVLKAAGYSTGCFGKWMVGVDPHAVGCDYYSFIGSDLDAGAFFYYDSPWNTDGVVAPRTGYATELIEGDAEAWITATDPAAGPWAAFVYFNAPHSFTQPKNGETLYNGVVYTEPATFHDTRKGRASAVSLGGTDFYPDFWKGWEATGARSNQGKNLAPAGLTPAQQASWLYQEHTRDYFRTVKSVDDMIGQGVAYLAATGHTNDTAVFFTGDNGYEMGDHNLIGKQEIYEESIRVPLIIKSPGEITPGTVDTRIALNVDVPSTILALLGLSIPSQFQGRSLLGAVPGDWRTNFYYSADAFPVTEGIEPSGIVSGTKKYAAYRESSFVYEIPFEEELIDLAADPLELSNRIGMPEYQGAAGARADLTCQYHVARKQIGVTHSTVGVRLVGGTWR